MGQVSLQMFGAFRDFNEDNLLLIDYVDGMTVTQLKDAIEKHLNGQEPYVTLLMRSRIADVKQIFMDGDTLTGAGEYALLPPVNGG